MIEVTQNDCQRIISAKLQSEDFEILDFQLIPFDEIIGYLGEHCTLQITYVSNSTTNTSTFFVKSLPQVAPQRKFLEDFNGIVKEKNFYTKFYPLLKEHKIDILDGVIPKCYYKNEESFFFEDLAVQGYKTLPSRIPLKFDCVTAALSSFAKLHASALILEEVKKNRLTDDFEEELQESFYFDSDSCVNALKSCRGGIKALIDITHEDNMKISEDIFKKKAIEGCEKLPDFVKPSTKFRNTICHADAYAKNLLFKFEEDKVIDCVIVDFQTYRYGPPAQDVLTFIHVATDRKFRQKYLEELLEFYYKELSSNIEFYGFKDVVTRGEFFASCSFYRQFALTQTLVHFHVVILSDEIAKELFGDEEKAKFVVFEDRYDFVKMVCERDPIYRHRSIEAITDLREFFESQLQ